LLKTRPKLTDTEIKRKGFRILIEKLGDVDAEKFISLINKEPFDYTQWQSTLWSDKTIDQVSEKAMDYRTKNMK
jgi:hypothetical protein